MLPISSRSNRTYSRGNTSRNVCMRNAGYDAEEIREMVL
jgi:hypothetical protein